MVIYFGADHRGFNLKQGLIAFLGNQGYELADLGNTVLDEGDDYPDFAAAVAKKVSLNSEQSRGVLICGSGVGMDIAANKFRHIRAALGFSADQVFDARHDDDVNILCLPADFISDQDAQKMLKVFLETPFADDARFRRRLEKISQIENE
ncbi:MAG: RpiB/LacA/LacB family sugar-phosphate isomerase [Patescibacteria group bacterium]